MRDHHYYVYILGTERNGTFYVGVTNDLPRRVAQHKEGRIPGFTKQYGIKNLYYYELHEDIYAAINREKSVKRWTRQKKMCAIEAMNPDWRDLFTDLF